MSVNFHYCCDKLEKVSLYHTDEKGCCDDEKEMSSSCCHDESYVFKINDHGDSDKVQFAHTDVPVFVEKPISLKWVVDSCFYALTHLPFTIEDPPPLRTKTPLYIQKRVLLI